MTANAMSGVETASIQRRVREVMTDGPPFFLTWLQPLYGIHGTAVDPHLKVQRRGPGWCEPNPAHLCTCFNGLPLLEGRRGEIAIKRVAVAPMVEDDQRAEPGERAGETDGSAMEGAHRRVLVRGDLDPVPRGPSAAAIGR